MQDLYGMTQMYKIQLRKSVCVISIERSRISGEGSNFKQAKSVYQECHPAVKPGTCDHRSLTDRVHFTELITFSFCWVNIYETLNITSSRVILKRIKITALNREGSGYDK